MKNDSQRQVHLGNRVVSFTEEAQGIIALPLFQPASCRAMIEAVRGNERWQSAKVSRRAPDGEVRSIIDTESRMANVLFSEHLDAIRDEFDEQMNAVLKPLVNQLYGHNLTEHAGTQVVHYTPGGHYRPHSDVGLLTKDRYYSVLCYLNDDFDGGGTRFPALDYCVAPECGKAVIFPSGYLHGGEPVASGEKYVIVSWITGPPQD